MIPERTCQVEDFPVPKRTRFPPSIDSLHDALDAAICAQEQAFGLVLEAIGEAKDSKMAMLLAVHNRALELRLRAEAQYREALERRGIYLFRVKKLRRWLTHA